MPGHLEKRYKSSWTIVIDAGRDADGKRIRITKNVKGTKKEAEREMLRIMHELEHGTYVEPSKLTLGEYLEKWLNDYAALAVRPLTLESYRQQIKNHILPDLGHIPLDKLQPLHLQQHYTAKLQSGLSVRTVQYQHTILREALGHAVKWQLLSRNPAEAVESPRRQAAKQGGPPKKEVRALTPEEQKRLLETAKNSSYYYLILVAMYTGLRRGELLGLHWQEVHLEKKQLQVKTTLQEVGKKLVFQEPKSKKSYRTIPFPATVGNAFREIKKQQAQDKLQQGKKYQNNGLVFCQKDGRPHNPRNVSRQVTKLLQKAGISDATMHSLRHTFASTLINKGARLEEVQRLLGHESLSTTMDIYHHLFPGALEATVALLDE